MEWILSRLKLKKTINYLGEKYFTKGFELIDLSETHSDKLPIDYLLLKH